MAKNMVRFNPFGNIARFEPFGNMEQMFKDFRLQPSWQNLEAEPRIKMDVSETDKAYTVKAEIPGVKKENIKVAIEGNQVSIRAEVKMEKEEKKGETVICRERYQGQQYRRFTLEQDIDDSKAEAHFQDGVLELTLPKKTGSTKKQLEVH